MRKLLFLMCVLAFGAQAEVYKWKDASGRMIFSDQPPPASQGKAQKMNLRESNVTTVDSNQAAPVAASQTTSIPVQASAPAQSSNPVKPPRDDKACATATSRLTFLKNANMFKQVDSQGKIEFLPAKQREQEIIDQSAFIEKNCR